jgi:leucyl-tRNA synthetase
MIVSSRSIMKEKYLPAEIEERQQRRWSEARVFEVEAEPSHAKFYCLEMLPYPSGRIHMGHVRNYSIGDALACFKRMNALNVLHPIGWDAFGMPAENAAITNNARPDKWTFENIDAMKTQLKRMGFSYDWRREVASCTPDYYRWNQWFFIEMWKMGLLYRKKATVNWCPKCNTSLANEQAEGGFCWRHEDTEVEQRELEQWFIRVTGYADRLLDDLQQLEGSWPDRVIAMQRNWIGRSVGAEVDFALADAPAGLSVEKIRVFTTRIDTIYGANAVIVAPEHALIDALLTGGLASAELQEFVARAKDVSREDRIAEGTEKVGFDTGLHAINPFDGSRLPVWTANFVLTGYGTGAIMSVPGHDYRDFEFSQKYGLPVRQVIEPMGREAPGFPMVPEDDNWAVVNSGQWNSMPVLEAQRAMTEYAAGKGFGEAKVNFKIRDWGVSRQRAWGAPIPFIHCPQCGIVPVPEEQLPVVLPPDLNYNTVGSPLAEWPAFVNTSCPTCGGPARRDTDTMDTFVDSAWYYFRYCDPDNDKAPFDKDKVAYWIPVDQYIGGIEHAVLHLIYTRLWTKIMRDMGLVSFNEPIKRLLTQGMVCMASFRCPEHEFIYPTEVVNGACKFCGRPVVVGRIEKMSKSKKNTIDPDEMIRLYGADTVRLFMLFAAPPEKDLEWIDAGAEGAARFIHRVWRIVFKWHEKLGTSSAAKDDFSSAARSLRRKTHQTIKRVTGDFRERLHFNTAIAAVMELTNEIYAFDNGLKGEAGASDLFALREAIEALVKIMTPFTPHLAEELWQSLGHDEVLVSSAWPSYDEELALDEQIEIPVQLNGRLVARVMVAAGSSDDDLRSAAMADAKVRARLDGREINKLIVVPGRLVSIVLK